MRLLAIETATPATAAAVGEGAEVDEIVVPEPNRHTESLLAAVSTLLDARGWRTRDLDGVVVDVGPGLFTGLRVGIATAKGLAVAAGMGLFAVTSTDVLAQVAFDAGVRGAVVVVVDARRGEVFVAHGSTSGSSPATLGDVVLSTPSALAGSLRAHGGVATVLGDGAARHRDLLAPACAVLRDDLVVPSPSSAIRLVARRVADGEAASDHRGVHPWYLREADAVANYRIRDGAP